MNKILLFLLPLIISGCSFFGKEDDPTITPAILEDIAAEVELKRLWTAKVGVKKEDYLITLRPFVSRERLITADYEGKIVSLNPETGKQIWDINLETSLSGGVGYLSLIHI